MKDDYQPLFTSSQRKFNQMTKKSILTTLALGILVSCILMIVAANIYNGKIQVLNYKNFDLNTTPIDLIPVSRNEKNSIRIKPIVLYWEHYFHTQYDHFIPTEKTKIQCSYECIHTSDREYAANASVRIFHHRKFNWEDRPPNNPKALNVFFTLEPPYLSYSYYNASLIEPDYFNVTGSHRSSSEIYFPYDYFIKLDGTETKEQVWTEKEVCFITMLMIDQKITKKHKIALVAMSNCRAESKRHDYIHGMDEYINITKLGRCEGKIVCGKDGGSRAMRKDIECMQNLIDEHYFYLAFENSVCPEYVTEKFWRVKNLIVPIVLSRAVIPSHIPDNSFIAASDFESPKALTDYLKYLASNTTEYRKYFEWTKTYRKTRITEEEIAVSCQLCKLAHQDKPYRIKNYRDYLNSKDCVKNYALNLLDNKPDNLNNVACHEQSLSNLMKATYRPRSIGKIL